MDILNSPKIPTLPIYLHKYIIKEIICKNINRYCKEIEPFVVGKDYRVLENEIKLFILSISLVSKLWFKVLSDNIYVCVDFNNYNLSLLSNQSPPVLELKKPKIKRSILEIILGKKKNNNSNNNNYSSSVSGSNYCNCGGNSCSDNGINGHCNCNSQNENEQYKIIKKENISLLKLHYNHSLSYFYRKSYKDDNEKDFTIDIQLINKKMLEFKQLQKLVIRNIDIAMDEILFLKDLKIPKVVQQIKILEIKINYYTTENSLIELYKVVNKVFSFSSAAVNDVSIFFCLFKLWQQSLRQIFIFSNFNFPIIELSGINILDDHQQKREDFQLFNNSNINNGIDNNSLNNSIDFNNSNNNNSNDDDLNNSNSKKKFLIHSINNINYLKNINYYDLSYMKITLKELYCIFESSRNLKFLSIEICLSKLSYLLGRKVNIKECKCQCSSVFNDDSNPLKHESKFRESLYYWDLIKKNLIENGNNCSSFKVKHFCTQRYYVLKKSFEDELISLFSSFNNLKEITLGLTYYDFFLEFLNKLILTTSSKINSILSRFIIIISEDITIIQEDCKQFVEKHQNNITLLKILNENKKFIFEYYK